MLNTKCSPPNTSYLREPPIHEFPCSLFFCSFVQFGAKLNCHESFRQDGATEDKKAIMAANTDEKMQPTKWNFALLCCGLPPPPQHITDTCCLLCVHNDFRGGVCVNSIHTSTTTTTTTTTTTASTTATVLITAPTSKCWRKSSREEEGKDGEKTVG